MKTKVMYHLIDQLFALRKKEVLEGLTYEEERKLSMIADEIDRTYAKRKPLNTQGNQMESEVLMVSIHKPNIVKKIQKQTFFEKVRKQEPNVYYELALADEANLDYKYYTYAFMCSVQKFMKQIGLEKEWLLIAPPTFDYDGGFEFHFTKEEGEWLSQLQNPKESLQALDQMKDIEEKARMHSIEMFDFITRLKEFLAEDYVIYIDYTNLQYIEVG